MTYGSGNSGDYKKLKGQNIQVLDTDPVVFAGTWATGGDMNTARFNTASGFGTQTAGAVAGGAPVTTMLVPAGSMTKVTKHVTGDINPDSTSMKCSTDICSTRASSSGIDISLLSAIVAASQSGACAGRCFFAF